MIQALKKLKSRRWVLLAAFALCAIAAGSIYYYVSQSRKPNIIVILVDTLRADHLGYHGYDRKTSPIIDKFARENIIFKNAMSSSNWTPPSVASLFTGLYPTSHGWKLATKRGRQTTRLSGQLTTLAETLKKDGYVTGAVTANAWIGAEFGFDQGFDFFTTKSRARANQVNSMAMKTLKQMTKQDKPFFLYMHFLDPHEPYSPPKDFAAMFPDAPPGEYPQELHRDMNLYDGEIRYLDASIGKFFDHLKKQGLYDNSVIIFVADHGQQFMEHGDVGHGYQLYNEEVHIPLIVKVPGSARTETVNSTVSLVDVMPTILGMIDIKPPAGLPGVDLLDSSALSSRHGVMVEVQRDYTQRAYVTADGKKLIHGTPKKIRRPKAEAMKVVGVFDFHKDVGERQPLGEEQAAALRKALDEQIAVAVQNMVEGETGVMKESTMRQLKALNYLK